MVKIRVVHLDLLLVHQVLLTLFSHLHHLSVEIHFVRVHLGPSNVFVIYKLHFIAINEVCNFICFILSYVLVELGLVVTCIDLAMLGLQHPHLSRAFALE